MKKNTQIQIVVGCQVRVTQSVPLTMRSSSSTTKRATNLCWRIRCLKEALIFPFPLQPGFRSVSVNSTSKRETEPEETLSGILGSSCWITASKKFIPTRSEDTQKKSPSQEMSVSENSVLFTVCLEFFSSGTTVGDSTKV